MWCLPTSVRPYLRCPSGGLISKTKQDRHRTLAPLFLLPLKSSPRRPGPITHFIRRVLETPTDMETFGQNSVVGVTGLLTNVFGLILVCTHAAIWRMFMKRADFAIFVGLFVSCFEHCVTYFRLESFRRTCNDVASPGQNATRTDCH